MSYFDGFVIAVPTENKQKFIDHANKFDNVFIEFGAIRVVECWGDDVSKGKLTDFYGAVQAKDNESIVFSWVEWPDKSSRDVAMDQMKSLMSTDERLNSENNPMPFDGARMIYGGFDSVLDMKSGQNRTMQPYLFFRGRCEEAIEFYKKALGAKLNMMMRFRDNPEKTDKGEVSTELDDKIMHASLEINGANIMMSDGMKAGPVDFECMSLSLSVPDEKEADRLFNALAADGTVQMPMDKTFFSPRFGAVTDKFGVSWMIIVEQSA